MNVSLSLYRTLLRSVHVAFKDDSPAIKEAYAEIKKQFYSHKDVGPSDPVYEEKIQWGQDVARILKSNVVQGRQRKQIEHTQSGHTDNGHGKEIVYRFKMEPRHEMADNSLSSACLSESSTPPQFVTKRINPLGPCAVRCSDCACS